MKITQHDQNCVSSKNMGCILMKKLFLICLTFLISCVNSNENKMPVVELDIQSWQANNLDVVTFRNGDSIKQALNSQDWINAGIKKEPCWAYYGFGKEKKGDESKYYNWYAVNDPRNLAPQGFIIPSVSDVERFISFLGNGILDPIIDVLLIHPIVLPLNWSFNISEFAR